MSQSQLERKLEKLEHENTRLNEELQDLACSYSVLLEKYRKLKTSCAELRHENQQLRGTQTVPALASSLCGSALQVRLQTPTHNSASHRMFEAFFILGLPGDDRAAQVPIILESYPQTAGYQSTLIASFAFPTGYTVSSLDLSESSSQLYQLMYPSYERDRHSYVFCIKAQEPTTPLDLPGLSNKSKEILYGCCVVEQQLGSATHGSVRIVPTCYCLLSYLPCFELHFQVLYSLLSTKKAQALRGSPRDELQRLSVHTSGLSYEQEMVLAEYYHDFVLGSRRKYTISPQVIASVDVQLPKQLDLLDTEWACSLMFSVLTLDEFFQVFCAALLERSVIFVSNNLDSLSSCVLGLEALLKPLKWPFVVAPILPQALYVALDSPVPVIAGVAESFTCSNSKMLRVYLDQPKKRLAGKRVKELHAGELKEYLESAYHKFEKGPCYSPDPIQIKAVHRIASDIKEFLLGVLEAIPVPAKRVKRLSHKQLVTVQRAVLAEADSLDAEFLQEFTATQMFVAYVESVYIEV